MSLILLVRHGQASFGTDDYDRLSPHGLEQSRILGADLSTRDIMPELLVSGSLTRQLQTAHGVAQSAGWRLNPSVDEGWNEYHATDLLNALPDGNANARTDSRAYQRLLEKAAERWASGDHDGDYQETFSAFTDRVDSAFDRVISGLGSGQTAVCFSSAGAIAWISARLLGCQFRSFIALNRVSVNSGVTKIVTGASGTSLISLNDHGHLASGQVTYR